MQKIYAKRQNVKSEEQQKKPKKATVEFLKQFARMYSYQAIMQPDLGEFTVN